MKRVFDFHQNKAECFVMYLGIIFGFAMPCLFNIVFNTLNFLFWGWVIFYVCFSLILIQHYFYQIKMIEIDNEKLVIHKKDCVIKLNQEDIISFNVISNLDGSVIKILTKNENIEIKIGINESINLLPFLYEIKSFINNSSFEGKLRNTNKFEDSPTWEPSFILVLVFILGLATSLINFSITSQISIVKTDNLDKAYKIQSYMAKTGISTTSQIYKSGRVKLGLDCYDEADINRVIIKIANSEYFDKDVRFIPNDYGDSDKKATEQKHTKWLNKILTKRLKSIPGVFDIDMDLGNSVANITVYTSDDFDKEKITKIIKNITIGTSDKYTENSININFSEFKNVTEKLISKHKKRYAEWLSEPVKE